MFKYLIIILVLFFNVSVADVNLSQQVEVAHLLSFIKNSNCGLIRNGESHVGKEAAKHINKKYDYYRDDINTTEDFIAYSATKSALSGKYYKVSCPGRAEIKSQDWLLQELKAFRDTR